MHLALDRDAIVHALEFFRQFGAGSGEYQLAFVAGRRARDAPQQQHVCRFQVRFEVDEQVDAELHVLRENRAMDPRWRPAPAQSLLDQVARTRRDQRRFVGACEVDFKRGVHDTVNGGGAGAAQGPPSGLLRGTLGEAGVAHILATHEVQDEFAQVLATVADALERARAPEAVEFDRDLIRLMPAGAARTSAH